jgi:predicted helicase
MCEIHPHPKGMGTSFAVRLKSRIDDYFDGKITISTKSWDYEKAKTETTKENALNKIIQWNFRGFDVRYLCYDTALLVRDRYELMQYLIPPNDNNLTLIVNRQNRSELASSFFISNKVFDNKCCEGASGLHSYAFPIRISESDDLDNPKTPKKALDSNIDTKFKSSLMYENEISDEDIFYYIYGILYTPTYRKRYYLGFMEDYPRIPFSNDIKIFSEMSLLGKRLAELHLLKAGDLDDVNFEMGLFTDYKIYYIRKNDKDKNGNQIPDTYDPETNKIYFNKRKKSQIQTELDGNQLDDITWIGGITQEMWDFEIGGRQQLKEWLYTRMYSEEIKKNTIQRALNTNELKYFLKMCDAIKKTIELLSELDEVYKKIDP